MKFIQIDKNIAVIYFAMISCLFLLVFSISSSPLYPVPFIYDSGTFQIIGKGWMEGELPYRDLWDNKGPLLYLINGIGYLITGNKTGVFILQVINLTIAIFIVYRLFLLEFSPFKAILFSTFALLWLSNTIYNNSVGEYILIPINLSYLLIYKWLQSYNNEKKKHPCLYSMFYGFTLGCGFLLRITDVFPFFITLIIISIYILRNNQWKNWMYNFFICICCFILTIIPFILYFLYQGILDDFWFATILHNIEYVKQSNFQSYYLYAMGSFILSFTNYIAIILVGILVLIFNKKRTKIVLAWIIPSLIMLCFIFNTYANSNYAISSLPFFCFVIIELVLLKKKIYQILLYLFLGFILLAFTFQVWQNKTRDIQPNNMIGLYKIIEDKIPVDERNSFIAFNCETDIYYYTSLKPCYPYFLTKLTYLTSEKDSLRKRIIETYKTCHAKWILVCSSYYPNFISDILDEHYKVEMFFPDVGLQLFHLK